MEEWVEVEESIEGINGDEKIKNKFNKEIHNKNKSQSIWFCMAVVIDT